MEEFLEKTELEKGRKKMNNKKLVVILLSAFSVTIVSVAAIVFIAGRNSAKSARYHDSWMPKDIDWSIYLGESAPNSNKGFDDDYYVVVNTWETFHKENGKWIVAGYLIDLEGVTDTSIQWVSQLYDLYCETNDWYKGNKTEWVYDFRDQFLFTKTYYTVSFFGEKTDNPTSYGSENVRRRGTVVYNGTAPIKQFDAQHFYSFSTWDKDLSNVTDSFSTFAVFTSYDNGTLVKPDGEGNYCVGFDEDDAIKQNIISLDIPEQIDGHPVTKISDGAFSRCSNLKSIILPSSIEYIGEHAFFGCSSLKEIVIPKSVTHISEVAFSSALYSLESIRVEAGNPNYKDINGVLYTSNDKTIVRYPPSKKHGDRKYIIPNQITAISSFCFSDFKGIDEFILPSGLNSIGTWVFKNTDINKLVIPDNCTISSGNFISGCTKLQEIDTVDSIHYKSDDGILYSKDLTKIYRIPEGKDVSSGFVIPSSVTTLGAYCFSGTNITSLTIPSCVTTIESYCFSYLDYCISIYVPDSVNYMYERAFYYCHNLIVNCQILKDSIPSTWESDWAHEHNYEDVNDIGYVKKINWGVS